MSGRIQTGSYKKDGKTRYTKSLVVDKVDFVYGNTSSALISGNLAGDSKLTYIPSQSGQLAVLDFTVCVNRSWDKAHADFFPVTIYGKRAEALARKLIKGASVTIKGRLDTDSYKSSDGGTVYTWRVIPSSDDDAISDIIAPKEKDAPADTAPVSTEDLESTGFVELPDEFDEEYFDDEF